MNTSILGNLMEQQIVEKKPEEGVGSPFQRYRSVEFSIQGLEYLHQFPIWNSEAASMFVLVREDSEIVGRLKVGDVMKMKYYTDDTICPTTVVDTEIRHITKDDEGRFKGHYLIGLGVCRG
jgi:hypothetical protein